VSVQNPGTASGLTWTMAPSIGTLPSSTSISGSPTNGTSANTYTAPNPVPSQNTIMVTACMSASPTVCSPASSVPLVPVSYYTISATPMVTAVAGTTATYTVVVTGVGGFNGTVGLTTTNGTLSPTSITGSGSSTLTVNVPATTAPAIYNLKITGTSGGSVQPVPVTLVVPCS
jgi:hypothetical protein